VSALVGLWVLKVVASLCLIYAGIELADDVWGGIVVAAAEFVGYAFGSARRDLSDGGES
jgi:hypothetical protein